MAKKRRGVFDDGCTRDLGTLFGKVLPCRASPGQGRLESRESAVTPLFPAFIKSNTTIDTEYLEH